MSGGGLLGFKAKNHPQQIAKNGVSDEVDDRGTPPELFDPLMERFGFTLDVAAAAHNAKCERYCSRADLIVMLVPANRPEQAWWQDNVEPFRDRPASPLRVEFIRNRQRFIRHWLGHDEVKPNERPPFGVCLLIWSEENRTHRKKQAEPVSHFGREVEQDS